MLPNILGIFFKKGKHYGHRGEAGQKGQRTEKTETPYPGGTGGEGWNRPEVHRPDREGRDEPDCKTLSQHSTGFGYQLSGAFHLPPGGQGRGVRGHQSIGHS